MCLNNKVMYIRKKKVKKYTYYYIVEGKLQQGKVKQKVIYYIGTIDTLLKKLKLADKILNQEKN